MKRLVRHRHFYYMLVMDAALVVLSYVCAYLLRYEGQLPGFEWERIFHILPYLLAVKLLCFAVFGLYRGMWRYTGLEDMKNVVKATAASSLILVLFVLYAYHFVGYSRAAFIIDGLLTVLFIGGIRVAVRVVLNRGVGFGGGFFKSDPARKKLIIIGAGAAGEKVIREVMDNPVLRFNPVGFLDDDPAKWGKSIHGVSVFGGADELNALKEEFDEILIAIPSAKGEQIRRIADLCEATGKRFRTMPSIGELIDGKVSLAAIREVGIEDILGRDEVRLERDLLKYSYANKRILVTGAGGSIGRELVRQICRYHPEELALLDFSEFNLFQVEGMCREDFPDVPIRTFLTDIRDRSAVARTFQHFEPQVVFHAAAYKHVPLQEMHPRETVYNNILGTMNLAEAAKKTGAARFVLVSTDKAVRPTNVMGAAKRVAEMIVQNANGGSQPHFMAVRFGNVLGSSGSVVPIFQQQIAHGQPVTVTHPEVTRYFMSIPEAAQLILQAGAMGKGGEIFILDMGKPVRIADMARDLIRLHGLEPEKDIPVRYIGLRPGEKLYEELITAGEGIEDTTHEKIKVLRRKHEGNSLIEPMIVDLLALADTYDESAIKKKLREIVPEYTPNVDP